MQLYIKTGKTTWRKSSKRSNRLFFSKTSVDFLFDVSFELVKLCSFRSNQSKHLDGQKMPFGPFFKGNFFDHLEAWIEISGCLSGNPKGKKKHFGS